MQKKYIVICGGNGMGGMEKALNEKAADGYGVISAHYDGGVWSAIMHHEVLLTTETQPAEASDLLEAARKIADHCAKWGENCGGCPLWGVTGCLVKVNRVRHDGSDPENWRIAKED